MEIIAQEKDFDNWISELPNDFEFEQPAVAKGRGYDLSNPGIPDGSFIDAIVETHALVGQHGGEVNTMWSSQGYESIWMTG